MKHKIPEIVIEISNKLEKNGFEAFLVGGCVRDLILNREPKDWDLTTNAKPDEILKIFPDSVYENDFGTVGVKTESEDPKLKIIEITPYRLESNYSDNRHPDNITFGDNLEEDLKRRDFTINAMAYSVSQETLTDPFMGQADIKSKTIRTVGEPKERFNEDALRILRAIRFSAELGFTINTDTLNPIVSCETLLNNVSRERIKDEFTKIILSDNPMIGLVLCQKTNVLQHISVKLVEMVGVDQNKQAHKYDVWEHSLKALQHAADKKYSKEVRIAALFHDIGKPETKKTDSKGNTSFYNHEVVGAYVARETLKNLKFDKETTQKVFKLVRWHMFFSDTEQITLSAVRRVVRNIGPDMIWELINLRICDRIGTGRPKEEPYRLRKFKSMIEEVIRDPISVSMLKIDGNILMKDFEIEAGPKIGNILHILLEEVLENPENNNYQYLSEKVNELKALKPEELVELGKKAKETAENVDDSLIKEIRDKNKVK